MNEPHPLFVRHLSRGQLIALDLLAGLVLSLLFLTVARPVPGLPSGGLTMSLALGLPLALRRRWPVPVFCLSLVLSVVAVTFGSVGFAYIAPAYALYIVALVGDRGAWVPTTAIAVLTLVTLIGLVVMGGSPQAGAPPWFTHLDVPLLGIAALGGAWTVGRAVRERRIYAARDAERLAEKAVTEERLRIARELHDVVTHSVGMIAVKAGVANHVMHTRPEEAHDALRVIETVSRSALVEMRHLLGVLRSSDAPDLGPLPGLSGLQGLAERARLAGVEVELDIRRAAGTGGNGVAGDVGAFPATAGTNRQRQAESATAQGVPEVGPRLPEGLERSVYRIVQEALTNVVKHAAPTRCLVSVVAETREVRIEVTDEGSRRRTVAAPGAGHGLIGMRERVMMFGGTLEAGALPGRGFRVLATLPCRSGGV